MIRRKDLDSEQDDRWRTKGGPFHCPTPVPDVCPSCGGTGSLENGEPCPQCEGTGEVWE